MGSAGAVDKDGDGYASDEDCDDNNKAVHPGATEICDGIDNDCDGVKDEGCQQVVDHDGDGYASDEDCDDNNKAVHPGATEICDGIDNDCDGVKDEGCQQAVDHDGDGYASDEDCDDNNKAVHPGAAEICDGIDNDCDGQTDEGCDELMMREIGGPDNFGYRYISSAVNGGPEYEWESFSNAAQSLYLDAREKGGLANAIRLYVPDPDYPDTPDFIFDFYGRQYNSVYLAANGYLTFRPDSTYTNFIYEGGGLPALPEPKALIAPFWGETEEGVGAYGIQVTYETLGRAPERRFVIQFDRLVNVNADNSDLDFQVVLYEVDDSIRFNYRQVTSAGSDFNVAGIADLEGSAALAYQAVDFAGALNERSVLFYLGDPPDLPEVEPEPEPVVSTPRLYLPLVMNNNWQTSVGVINDSQELTVNGVLEGRDNFGEIVAESDPVALAPMAKQEFSLTELFPDTFAEIAYVTFSSDYDTVVGYAGLKVDDYGLGASYATVAGTEAATELSLPMILAEDGWSTALALANAGDVGGQVEIVFNNGARKSLFLAPLQQVKFFPLGKLQVLNGQGAQLALEDYVPAAGAAVISSEVPLVASVMYNQGQYAGATALRSQGATELDFTNLINNGDWWTGLRFFNADWTVGYFQLRGYADSGSEVPLPLGSGSYGNLEARSFNARNLVHEAGGWLRMTTSTPVSAMQFIGSVDGKQMGVLPVGATRSRRGMVPLGNGAGQWCGLCLQNPTAETSWVHLIAFDDSGSSQAEGWLSLPPYGQKSDVAGNFFTENIDQAGYIWYLSGAEINAVVFNGRDYDKAGYPLRSLEALPALKLAVTGDLY